MTEDPLRATVTLRGVLLEPDTDVHIVKRASDGGWELPGGRLDASEDALDGLRREIVEETSLEPSVDHPVHAISWRNDADRGRFAVYYRCQVQTRSVSLSDEHTAAEWLSPGKACSRLSDAQANAVQRACRSQ